MRRSIDRWEQAKRGMRLGRQEKVGVRKNRSLRAAVLILLVLMLFTTWLGKKGRKGARGRALAAVRYYHLSSITCLKTPNARAPQQAILTDALETLSCAVDDRSESETLAYYGEITYDSTCRKQNNTTDTRENNARRFRRRSCSPPCSPSFRPNPTVWCD